LKLPNFPAVIIPKLNFDNSKKQLLIPKILILKGTPTMQSFKTREPEEIVAYIGRLMFKRRLTDIAGGNVSIREGKNIYISPRYAGQKWHWQLEPHDIVSGPVVGNELIGDPSFSREGLSHLAIYKAFPEVKGIVHAHPLNVLPFCSIEKPIEPVLRAVEEFGELEYHDPAPEYSQAQADSIVEKLNQKREALEIGAAAVLMPKHGIIAAGSNIWTAIDAVERINTNAWCIIASKILNTI
jgi:L-fuculose-phosphate aldolase